MRIVILGAGSTGSYIASILSEKKHDVTLIDRNGKLLEQIGRSHDVATLHASFPNVKVLQELGEANPDLFFAATGNDETNLTACCAAKKLGFKKCAARVKSREYLDKLKLDWGQIFQIDYFIGAEVLAAQGLFEALIHAGDVAVDHFAHGAIQMRTFLIPHVWDRGAIPIRDLALPEELIVGLIRRKTVEEDKILFPHGEDFILPGDEATIVGEVKVMRQLHEIFHYPEHKVRSVIIVGGTAVAIHLSHFLNAQKIGVRLIEENAECCERLAEELPNATIIHRDPQDPELMQSERVQDTDAFISCTDNEGVNFLVAALAKEAGCPRAMGMITDPNYRAILEKAGVVPVLSARINIANRILSILHEETIISIGSLSCDRAKIIECKVSPQSKMIGIPLSQLAPQLPKDLIITVIESKGQVAIGHGHHMLSAEDTVIAICHTQQISQIPHLFH